MLWHIIKMEKTAYHKKKKILEIYNDLSDIEIGELRYHIKQLYAERKKTKKSQTA